MRVSDASLILASGSQARQTMLRQAGVAFETRPADIDETVLKDRLQGQAAEVVAAALADAKALYVSRLYPGAWVIGSDQILEFDGQFISKAATLAEARDRLTVMRGRSHRLVSGVSLARAGQIVWSGHDAAVLHMRPFSDGFLDAYLDSEGTVILQSVGSYRLEGLGSQLFDRIEGDYFTILGMPLWPLLAQLRACAVLMS
jgi:Nucleotide-binding protein implicated in inhibition of septum formation